MYISTAYKYTNFRNYILNIRISYLPPIKICTIQPINITFCIYIYRYPKQVIVFNSILSWEKYVIRKISNYCAVLIF